MRDCWYADNRDLVKWGVLTILAGKYQARSVIQVAYYNPCVFGTIDVDGEEHQIPGDVLSHFRSIGNIETLDGPAKVSVFDAPFLQSNRAEYHDAVTKYIRLRNESRAIVFLDPDTGLEPNGKADYKHVLNEEVRTVWESLPTGWLLVFYQHKTNRSGLPWIELKRAQLATALKLNNKEVKLAQGPKIANDVVFFFAVKR
ncbi:MAG: hypothetical protein FPO08_07420 [Geobacter sp.]|nr:MAG: hypothetical protein FPO08_07420 [Geobacter sp.]